MNDLCILYNGSYYDSVRGLPDYYIHSCYDVVTMITIFVTMVSCVVTMVTSVIIMVIILVGMVTTYDISARR